MEQDEKNLQLVAISDYDLDVVQTYYGSERSLHNPLSYIPPTTATTTTTTSSESANSLSDHALMMSRLHEEQQNQQNQQNQQHQQHNQNLQRDSNSPNTLSSQDILTNGTSSISWPSCYSILVACMAQEDEQRQAIALEENRTFYEVRENLRNQLAQLRNDYKRAHAEVGYEDTSDELSFGREVPVLRKVVVPPHPASTPLHDYKNGSSESNEMLSSLPKSSTSSTNHVNNNNNITSSSSSSSTSALAKANKEFHKRRSSQSSELTSSSARRRSTGVYIINSESLQHIHLPRNFDENVDAVLNSDSDNEHNHTTKQNEKTNNEEEVELNSLRRSAPRDIKARGALRSKQEMNAQHKMKRRSPNNVTNSNSNNNTPNSDTGSNNDDDDVLTIHNDPCEPHNNTNAHHKKEKLEDDKLDHDELDSHSQCIINVNDDDDDDNDNNEEDETLLTINTPAPRKVGAKVSNEKSNFAPLQLQNSHDNNNNINHDDSNDEKHDANPTHTIHMVPLIYDNTTDDESNDEIDINKNSSSSPTKAMNSSSSMNNSNKNNANGMSSSKDENDTRAFQQQDQSTHSSDESFLSYTTTQHYHDEVQFFYKQESIRRQRLVNWEEEARDIIAQSALSDYFRTLAEEGNYSDDSTDDDDVY